MKNKLSALHSLSSIAIALGLLLGFSLSIGVKSTRIGKTTAVAPATHLAKDNAKPRACLSIEGHRHYSSRDVAIDKAGNLYVADTDNHRILKFTKEGRPSILAGSGTEGYADGVGTAARFYLPAGIVIDEAGNLYVADGWNHRIRKIAIE